MRMLLIGLIVMGLMSIATSVMAYITIGRLRRSRAEIDRAVAGGNAWWGIFLACLSLVGFLACVILFTLKSAPLLSAMLAIPVVVLVVALPVAWWNVNRASEKVWLANVADVRLWKFIDGGKTKEGE